MKIILGALIGDYIGSIYEINETKEYNFKLFCDMSRFTDDSILTIANIDAVLTFFEKNPEIGNYDGLKELVIQKMVNYGNMPGYYGIWFGKSFLKWLANPVPYESIKNGAAMRVSAAGILGRNPEDVKKISKIITDVSHNHPDSEKAAECVSLAIYYLRHGMDKNGIIKLIQKYYPNILDYDLNKIRPNYKFNATCEGSVPIALKSFIDSTSFEDALRISISMGGDSDTIAAICCSIACECYPDAEKFWDIIKNKADKTFMNQINRLEKYLDEVK